MAVSPLPRAPEIVEGVINIRGTVLPVIDIRPRFGFPASPLHPDQHFIAGPRRPSAGRTPGAIASIGLIQVAPRGRCSRRSRWHRQPSRRRDRSPTRWGDRHPGLAQLLSLEEASVLDAAMSER